MSPSNSDYASYVSRHWVDTHGQSISTDPGVYLPGEIASEELGEDPNEDDEDIETAAGKKRKIVTRSGKGHPAKIIKTGDGSTPSTISLTVIDDRRPDLTLVDSPIDDGSLARPYGRHACLFIEVKIDPSTKPNPHELVRPTHL